LLTNIEALKCSICKCNHGCVYKLLGESAIRSCKLFIPINTPPEQLEKPFVANWVPVNESLPSDGEWVLVWHTGYGTPKKAKFKMDAINSFRFDGGGSSIEFDGWNDNSGQITHWMKLPGPPEV